MFRLPSQLDQRGAGQIEKFDSSACIVVCLQMQFSSRNITNSGYDPSHKQMSVARQAG